MNILIEFAKKPLSFTQPIDLIVCQNTNQLKNSFQKIEKALNRGFYAAGYISYETGYGFEEVLNHKNKFNFPLLEFGIYQKPLVQRLWPRQKKSQLKINNLRLNISRNNYGKDINKIRYHIAQGDVYQITYCLKAKFKTSSSGRDIYDTLYREQPVPYSAYIETPERQIISLSPERFIKKNKVAAITEPMKGTWPRGKNLFSDILAKYQLHYDTKNRAENLMITDLLRNDLGKIGKNIRVPKLFTVTGYNTLYQMTSTVTATIPEKIKLYDLFAALFPSGSVTGAPKIRAMQIIKNLEKEERKIYTGAIGYITPQRDLYFNIPIRTILIENGQAEMGIGGGIVWDSTAEGEWQEGLLKASFLTKYYT